MMPAFFNRVRTRYLRRVIHAKSGASGLGLNEKLAAPKMLNGVPRALHHFSGLSRMTRPILRSTRADFRRHWFVT